MSDHRVTPIEISSEDFQKLGYQLIDKIAEFIDTIHEKPVTKGETPSELQKVLGNSTLPENGTSSEELLSRTADLLINHSLFNGHPKFLGYITSSAAPLGALADLLAAAVNPNVGSQLTGPIGTEIEKQTIKWLTEFIGLTPNYGGVLVSGGNMANFTGFLAGRTAKAPENFKENGVENASERLTVYCSKATHIWIEKAAILFGMGTKSIRWIPTNPSNKMYTQILEDTIKEDIKLGLKPIMVVGTAGDVSTGVVDDLKSIATICKKYDMWFHVDGAYGIPAAVVPSLKSLFAGVEEADSIALDPHKWLYSPLEAGCILVKNPQHLLDTFSSHPVYYNFDSIEDEPALNYYEYGLQNSRGFRALKVWLVLQQVGRSGYEKLISEDIELSIFLFQLAESHPELEAVTQNLSVATFRYIPAGYQKDGKGSDDYLNQLNEALLNELQTGGEAFMSNAIVNEKYCLRTCVVNFRTSEKDMKEIVEIVVRVGRKVHSDLQNKKLK